MKIGDTIHGFTVINCRESEELEGTLWEMRHERTGAQLCWMDNGESNKLFCVGFKTVPWDDTGVFHILEHSVLGGSERYPVKEPFLDLLKGSMNTFLNAITFPDKTIYPVSSRNDQDFLNLTQVYLDAVFCPAVYTNPNIFRQEGWHYEMKEGETTPTYNGVVFNEMKGAYASVDEQLTRQLQMLIFPDSCYGKDSGGDPEHIPELTYERFLDAHRTFYHPGNARIWLDGAVPLDEVLRLMDEEYLSRFGAPRETPGIAMQTPVAAKRVTVPYEIGDEEDEANKAYITFGKILCDWQDRKRISAANIVATWLTDSVEAPLTKAILDSGLAQDVSIDISPEIAQPIVTVTLRNTEEKHRDALRKIVRETVEAQLEKGLDRAALEAQLDQAEYRLKDRHEPAGLIRCITALGSWLHGGDPMLYLLNGPVIKELREALDTDYYADVLRDMLLDDDHLCEACLVPSKTRGEEKRKAEQARLEAASADWTDADRAQVIAEFAELERWHNTPDTAEQTATLPQLELKDVSPEPFWTETEVGETNGVRTLFHPVASNGIVHSALYFAITDQSIEDMQAQTFMLSLMRNLPTSKHTVSELNRLIKQKLGRFNLDGSGYDTGDRTTAKPVLKVTFSSLDECAEDGADLVAEILTDTQYNDKKTIRDLLNQQIEQMTQSVLYAGTRYAVTRAKSSFSASGYLGEQMSGLTYLKWLTDLRDHFDERVDGLIALAERTRDTFFTRNRLIVSQTATRRNPLMDSLPLRFAKGEGTVPETLTLPVSDSFEKEAVVIPAGVSFAALATHANVLGEKWAPDLSVLEGVLTYGYLWNEIRVKGGAYGCGFMSQYSGNIAFHSFRDPSPVGSESVFDHTADFLKAFVESDEGLDRYIISAIGNSEPLQSPADLGTGADWAWFSGITREERRADRAAMLAMKKNDILARLPLFTQIVEKSRRCIVGSQAALEGLDEGWKVTKM